MKNFILILFSILVFAGLESYGQNVLPQRVGSSINPDSTLKSDIDSLLNKNSAQDDTFNVYIDQPVKTTSSPMFISPYVSSIEFDTSQAINADVGEVTWNKDDGTIDVGLLNGVALQLGQEMPVLCKNQTGSTIADGTPVMFAGALGASGRILIMPAIADGTYLAGYTLGLTTQSIDNGEDGYVTAFGKVRGIQTDGANYGESWVDGQILYVSATTAGYLTKIPPEAPNYRISIGVVVRAHATQGSVFVRPTWRLKMTEASDVDGTPLTTSGQFLVWNQDSSYFDPTHNINNYALTDTTDSLRADINTNTNNLATHVADVSNPHLVRLDQIENPSANTSISVGGNTITWNFTNPVGGMLFNMTGGWSGHVLEIMDSSPVGQGSTGDHLFHAETDRANVVAGHFENTNGGTALLVDGTTDMQGELSVTEDVTLQDTLNAKYILVDDSTTNYLMQMTQRQTDGYGLYIYAPNANSGDRLLLIQDTVAVRFMVRPNGAYSRGVFTIVQDDNDFYIYDSLTPTLRFMEQTNGTSGTFRIAGGSGEFLQFSADVDNMKVIFGAGASNSAFGGYYYVDYTGLHIFYGDNNTELARFEADGGFELNLLQRGTLASPPTLEANEVWIDTTDSGTNGILRIKL